MVGVCCLLYRQLLAQLLRMLWFADLFHDRFEPVPIVRPILDDALCTVRFIQRVRSWIKSIITIILDLGSLPSPCATTYPSRCHRLAFPTGSCDRPSADPWHRTRTDTSGRRSNPATPPLAPCPHRLPRAGSLPGVVCALPPTVWCVHRARTQQGKWLWRVWTCWLLFFEDAPACLKKLPNWWYMFGVTLLL